MPAGSETDVPTADVNCAGSLLRSDETTFAVGALAKGLGPHGFFRLVPRKRELGFTPMNSNDS